MAEGHQDSPKVPEQEWPNRIEVSCGSNICGDPIYSVESPLPLSASPSDDYNPETETYIPVSALLSDQAKQAGRLALQEAAAQRPEAWANAVLKAAVDALTGATDE